MKKLVAKVQTVRVSEECKERSAPALIHAASQPFKHWCKCQFATATGAIGRPDNRGSLRQELTQDVFDARQQHMGSSVVVAVEKKEQATGHCQRPLSVEKGAQPLQEVS